MGGYWVTTSSAVDEISDTPDSTSTGLSSVAVLPLPICPAQPWPQAYTSPVVLTAYEVVPPEARSI